MIILIARFLPKVFLLPHCMLSPLLSLLNPGLLSTEGVVEGMNGLSHCNQCFLQTLHVWESGSVCLGQSCHYNQDITGAEACSPAVRRSSVPLQILLWFFFTFLIQFALLGPALKGLAQLLLSRCSLVLWLCQYHQPLLCSLVEILPAAVLPQA